jgi:hypothetical protein
MKKSVKIIIGTLIGCIVAATIIGLTIGLRSNDDSVTRRQMQKYLKQHKKLLPNTDLPSQPPPSTNDINTLVWFESRLTTQNLANGLIYAISRNMTKNLYKLNKFNINNNFDGSISFSVQYKFKNNINELYRNKIIESEYSVKFDQYHVWLLTIMNINGKLTSHEFNGVLSDVGSYANESERENNDNDFDLHSNCFINLNFKNDNLENFNVNLYSSDAPIEVLDA